jgi:hypothetical protein
MQKHGKHPDVADAGLKVCAVMACVKSESALPFGMFRDVLMEALTVHVSSSKLVTYQALRALYLFSLQHVGSRTCMTQDFGARVLKACLVHNDHVTIVKYGLAVLANGALDCGPGGKDALFRLAVQAVPVAAMAMNLHPLKGSLSFVGVTMILNFARTVRRVEGAPVDVLGYLLASVPVVGRALAIVHECLDVLDSTAMLEGAPGSTVQQMEANVVCFVLCVADLFSVTPSRTQLPTEMLYVLPVLATVLQREETLHPDELLADSTLCTLCALCIPMETRRQVAGKMLQDASFPMLVANAVERHASSMPCAHNGILLLRMLFEGPEDLHDSIDRVSVVDAATAVLRVWSRNMSIACNAVACLHNVCTTTEGASYVGIRALGPLIVMLVREFRGVGTPASDTYASTSTSTSTSTMLLSSRQFMDQGKGDTLEIMVLQCIGAAVRLHTENSLQAIDLGLVGVVQAWLQAAILHPEDPRVVCVLPCMVSTIVSLVTVVPVKERDRLFGALMRDFLPCVPWLGSDELSAALCLLPLFVHVGALSREAVTDVVTECLPRSPKIARNVLESIAELKKL